LPALTLTEADLRRILTSEERSLLGLLARRLKAKEVAKALKCPEDQVVVKVDALRMRLAQARGRLEAPRVRQERRLPRRVTGAHAGKPVTLPATLPAVPKEAVMAESVVEPGPEPGEGFAERIERETRVEAAAVVADLARLRFRADQVYRVLRALDLDVPDEIVQLTRTGLAEGLLAGREERPEPAQAPVVPAQPEAPVEPAPGPAAAEKPPAAEKAPEEVPEHLRGMPGAGGGGPVTQRIATAEKQLQVYEALKAGTALASELEKTTGIPHARVSAHLRSLEAAGLVRYVGDRRTPGVETGRFSKEYAAVMPAAVKTETVDVQRKATPEELAKVRDWAVKTKAPFTAVEAIGAVSLPAAVVVDALGQLVTRQVLRASGGGNDEVLYLYGKPESPGGGAQIDAARKVSAAAPVSNGSAPVPGTGTGTLSSSHAVNEMIRAVRAAGGKAQKTGGEHIRVTSKDGRSCIIGGTPSNSGLIQDKAKIRKLGIAV
jgi:DNA-binding transcriptional ArsR family regulator